MLNLRQPSLHIGLMILAFCGLALNAGSSSKAFASISNSVSYPKITNSPMLIFDTLSTNSPTQLASKGRGVRPRKNRRMRGLSSS